MRGKKIDTSFVSEFVSNCVNENKTTAEEISAKAKSLIEEIDIKIREVEDLKKTRSKLCDVIISFDRSAKNKSEDRLILDFHSIEDKKLSLEFISSMEKDNHVIFKFPEMGNFKDPQGMIFCIKQMLALKIIDRQEDIFMRAENYESYTDFLYKSLNARPINKNGFIKHGTEN